LTLAFTGLFPFFHLAMEVRNRWVSMHVIIGGRMYSRVEAMLPLGDSSWRRPRLHNRKAPSPTSSVGDSGSRPTPNDLLQPLGYYATREAFWLRCRSFLLHADTRSQQYIAYMHPMPSSNRRSLHKTCQHLFFKHISNGPTQRVRLGLAN
jgi:hypothetical protein